MPDIVLALLVDLFRAVVFYLFIWAAASRVCKTYFFHKAKWYYLARKHP